MDMSKVRVFETAHDDLLSFVNASMGPKSTGREIGGPINTFDVGLVYVYEHYHPGDQMIRCFYRLVNDGTDLEAVWQTVGSGKVLGVEHSFDLFGTDPVTSTGVAESWLEILTDSGVLYVIDGQFVAPSDRVAYQHRLVQAVYEDTARYASFADGTFPEREDAK